MKTTTTPSTPTSPAAKASTARPSAAVGSPTIRSRSQSDDLKTFKESFQQAVRKLKTKDLITDETAISLQKKIQELKPQDLNNNLRNLKDTLENMADTFDEQDYDKEKIRKGMELFFQKDVVHFTNAPEEVVQEKLDNLANVAQFAGETLETSKGKCRYHIKNMNGMTCVNHIKSRQKPKLWARVKPKSTLKDGDHLLKLKQKNSLKMLYKNITNFDFMAVELNRFTELLHGSLSEGKTAYEKSKETYANSHEECKKSFEEYKDSQETKDERGKYDDAVSKFKHDQNNRNRNLQALSKTVNKITDILEPPVTLETVLEVIKRNENTVYEESPSK